ncbi:MAG TPA: efflux RND transporter permease subunit [Alphaproteobacteria bacterium]|nr:efflux RND transporter permease subunit [Alphaproteobacteria bacterium]
MDPTEPRGRRRFTDLFIQRPVLASVVSLLILLLGIQSFMALPIRQFPELTNTQITVRTTYPGANAEVIQGFMTTPLQQAVASAEGIDYMVSSSTQNTSLININLRLDADGDRALTEVMSKVSQVRNILPPEANDPVVTKQTGETTALMYVGFNSETMTLPQITDYLTRVVQPEFQATDGVAEARILGGQVFAIRIWLDPKRMAALGVTPDDVDEALRANNFVAAPGQIKGDYVQININAETSLTSADAFAKLVVAAREDTLIHLGNVARVELGPQSVDSSSRFNGVRAVYIGVYVTPTANPLTVIHAVSDSLPRIEAQFPPGLDATIAYDATRFIDASIDEVLRTIIGAAAIVITVIFLFLGAFRSTLIPIVTIPLSLIGAMFLMLVLGYSINLLTLLAMVLAIGLVVDDAIVVVENIFRHIEAGLSPKEAALTGAREIALPVIAMTITLAAVYAPIGFVTGLTGTLFREFAFTLAGAVIISGIIALTLSPMMCSKLLKPKAASGRFAQVLEDGFERVRRLYERALSDVLNYRPVMVVLGAVVLLSCGYFYMTSQKELAPVEDQGVVFAQLKAPPQANLDYMERYIGELDDIFQSLPETANTFAISGEEGVVTAGFAGVLLEPWSERERSQAAVLAELQVRVGEIAGLQVLPFPLSPLPGSLGGPQVQFVVTTAGDYRTLHEVTDRLLAAAWQSGLFFFVDKDLRFDTPQIEVKIDRAKANLLGIRMDDIGRGLGTLLGGDFVNRFNLFGRSYEVIPQLPRAFRFAPDQILDYQLRTASGEMVPLSTVARLERSVQPNALAQFQQLNSATISAVIKPPHTLGDGVDFMIAEARRLFPEGFGYDFQGESRQYVQESGVLVLAFGFALIVIFLVLAAQFESFRDPLIILVSVPMSISGALMPLSLQLASLNIYTQVGLVTLIGLISKHGILMVEFANKVQEREGLSRRAAIAKAAGIRLRPILMTTASMVVATVPLLTASGAGAKSRFDIGLVVACGLAIGTLFTLFVLPTIYTYLARERSKQPSAAQATDRPASEPA